MSKLVMTGAQPLIDLLDTANTDLTDLQAAALETRQASVQASSALRAGAKSQILAYGNLANHVQTVSDGDASFILSTGYGVRATRTPYPPLEPPLDVRTRINGTPGQSDRELENGLRRAQLRGCNTPPTSAARLVGQALRKCPAQCVSTSKA